MLPPQGFPRQSPSGCFRQGSVLSSFSSLFASANSPWQRHRVGHFGATAFSARSHSAIATAAAGPPSAHRSPKARASERSLVPSNPPGLPCQPDRSADCRSTIHSIPDRSDRAFLGSSWLQHSSGSGRRPCQHRSKPGTGSQVLQVRRSRQSLRSRASRPERLQNVERRQLRRVCQTAGFAAKRSARQREFS